MKALIVSSYPPPVEGFDVNGGYRRFGMFVQAIASISQTIDFLHFLPPRDSSKSGETGSVPPIPSTLWGVPLEVTLVTRGRRRETAWNHYGAGIFSIFDQPEYFSFGGEEQAMRLDACLDRSPDLVFVAGLPCMSPFLRLKRSLPPIFFDINDVDHRLAARTIFTRPYWLGKFVSLLQLPALIAAERRCVSMSTNSFVCSDIDVRHLERLNAGKGLRAIPNAVPLPASALPVPSEQTLLFLGFFGYRPNADAAGRLIERIFPLIRKKLPSARLIVAGKSPELIPCYGKDHEAVEFTGFVDDLQALYRRSRAICCPMTNGGGTRVKLVEAAGYAKPIVSTSIGAEGLSLENGSEILIRDSDGEIAAACIQLLTDDGLCGRLGNAARHKAQSLYDIESVRFRISELMREAVSSMPREDVNAY